MSGSWTSTLLWLVPLGGALLVLVLPLRDATRGALALLVDARRRPCLALAAAFDFDPSGGTQFEQSHAWVRDIGLTYHVGMDGLSLVLVALDRRRACPARSASGSGRGARTCAPTRR